MKPKSLILRLFLFRTLFLLPCIFSSMAFIPCNAQAIVGKWKGGSAKIYYSTEYAKEKGKSMEEMTAAEMGNYEFEFKSDHRFIETLTPPGDSKLVTMNGIWNLTGNDLQLTLEPKFNPLNKTTSETVSFSGNTIVNTSILPAGSRITKMISTSSKM